MYICYMNKCDGFNIFKEVIFITDSEEKARNWCDAFKTVYFSDDLSEWRSYRIAVIDEVIDDNKDDDYNNYMYLYEKHNGIL